LYDQNKQIIYSIFSNIFLLIRRMERITKIAEIDTSDIKTIGAIALSMFAEDMFPSV